LLAGKVTQEVELMSSSARPLPSLAGGALLVALAAALPGSSAGAPASAPPSAAIDVQALLVAPPEAVKELKATASLPVTSLPAAPNQPVRLGELLVGVDVSKMEKELAAARKNLESAQDEKRERTTGQEVVRGTASGGGSGGGQGPSGGRMAELQVAEANAMSELLELQTRITMAPLHAPADGYVVRHLYAVGATTKKRKPLLTFVEAKKLVLEATVPAAQAAPFAAGTEVKVASMIDPAQAFLGRIESATPAGEAVALRIRPAGLPFLTLGTTTPVTLSAAR
jgi:hypothetical protein